MKNNINPTTQDLRRKLQIRRKITAVVKKITREKIFTMWKIITTTLSEIIFSHLNPKYTPKKHSLNEEKKPRIKCWKQKMGSFLYIAKIGYYFNIFVILLVASSKLCFDLFLSSILAFHLARSISPTFSSFFLLFLRI